MEKKSNSNYYKKMNKNLEIYCVTNKDLKFLRELDYNLAAVGKEQFSERYIKCDNKENIFHKELYYSELAFHYWYWKNNLSEKKEEDFRWIGFCQKRRFWLQENITINHDEKINKKNFLKDIPKDWDNYDAIICKPINLKVNKFSKLIKKGWKNIIKNPLILIDENQHTIKLHFDMFHGYGIIDKAIKVMNEKDKIDFKHFIYTSKEFNPHIMFISKPKIANMWFKDLFSWLDRCEDIFGFEDLKGYETTRLYAYLAERYLSYWFKKYSKYLEWSYAFIDTEKN